MIKLYKCKVYLQHVINCSVRLDFSHEKQFYLIEMIWYPKQIVDEKQLKGYL